MTEPQPGRIYWSKRSSRFYQEGRRGAVSNFNATETLTRRPGEATWRDQMGRFVAARAVLEAQPVVSRFRAHDAQGRPFLSTEFVDKPVAESLITGTRLASNQMVVLRTTVVTVDGKTHVSIWSSKKGWRVDMEYARQQAKIKASGELMGKGYSVLTPTVGQYTVAQHILLRDVNIISKR